MSVWLLRIFDVSQKSEIFSRPTKCNVLCSRFLVNLVQRGKSTNVIPSEQNQAYKDAHKEANEIDPRHKDNYDRYNTKDGTMLQRLNNPSKIMLLPYPKKKN